MTEQPTTQTPPKSGAVDKSRAIDPRWRVYVPIEKTDIEGRYVFRTIDGTRYRRDVSGAIRKVNASTVRSKKERRKLRQKGK
jgi:hypothetical protein